jgi:CYTH domain-containing protein
MGKAMERKFLVVDDAWRKGSMSTFYRQRYLSAFHSCALPAGVAGWIKQ